MAANVKGLYPSLYRDILNEALEYAPEQHFIFNIKAYKIIVELNKICFNNVAT